MNTVWDNDKQLLCFITGEGGTGKSRIIDVIRKLGSLRSSNHMAVVVAAPTGLSAYNISGTTIHKLLSLPVEHNKPPNYSRLTQEILKVSHAILKSMNLLIIDEISMISSLTLLYIHLRLTKIFSSNQLFGGMSVLVLGTYINFLQ